MAETIKGSDVILLYRRYSQRFEEAAWKLLFQLEHEPGYSRDADTKVTKDGIQKITSELEVELSGSSLVAKGDKRIKELKKCIRDDELMEIWEIDKSDQGPEENSEAKGKFWGTYFQGKLTNYTPTAAAEDDVELSVEFAINGSGAEGWCTLNEEQSQAVSYVFKDTVKETEVSGDEKKTK